MGVEKLKTSAIHEAGHAVAFYLQFGLDELHRIGDIEIGHQLSYFTVVDMFEPSAAEKKMEAIMHCAGYAALAVAKYSEDEALLGTDSDFCRARMQVECSIESLKSAAVALLSSDRAKQLVNTLSQRLITEGAISDSELQDFFLKEDDF